LIFGRYYKGQPPALTMSAKTNPAEMKSLEEAAEYLKTRIAEIIADETPECEVGTENCKGTEADLVVFHHDIGDTHYSCKCCGIGYWY